MAAIRLGGNLETYSVEWWLRRLLIRLRNQRATVTEFAEFHDGRQRLAFASEKFQDVFGRRYGRLPANYMPRIVDAEGDRLIVQGFRYGDETEADEDVWAMWQRNQLDAESLIAHEIALVKGIAYAMVAPGDDGALITIEDPTEVIVESVPGNRRLRAAALKVYVDDDGYLRANLYLPTEVYRFRSRNRRQQEVEQAYSMTGVSWEQYGETLDDGSVEVMRNPLGVVPIVPLVNRPTREGTGRSEVAPVMGNQLAINKIRFDALVAAEAVAFPQRWFTNIDIPVDPDTGKDLAPFKPGIDVLWGVRRPTAEEVAEYGDKVPEAKFGQFDQADLSPYIDLIRQETVQMAAISATPYYQLVGPPTAVAPSGESIKSSESALVRKVARAAIHLGEGWEETMRLAGKVEEVDVPDDGETMWEDTETKSEGARTDSVMKQWEQGLIPDEFALEQLGYTQQEIRRINAMKAEQPPAPPPPEPAESSNGTNGTTGMEMDEVIVVGG